MLGKKVKVSVCLTLVAGMLCSGLTGQTSLAASKAKLKSKKMQLMVGQTKKIVIMKKNKKAVYKFTSSAKKKASVSKNGTVTAKKAGKANITVKETYKKKTRSLGKIAVTVKAKNTNSAKKETPSPTIQAPATQIPAVSAPPSAVPTSTVPGGDSPATKEPDSSSTPGENPTVTYKPIDQYVQDEDLSVPDGFMAVNPDVAGTVETITYDSTVIKEDEVVQRKAKVILPKDYDPNKQYPVLYMQHGIFGNEDSLTGDNVQNVIWNAIANGDAEEMIAVFPNACANEYGGAVDVDGNRIYGTEGGFNLTHYAAYNNFLNDLEQCLMPYINEHYSTLTERENTAICGFSMGGRVTLHIGFTLQSKFRYIGAFCPAPGIFKHNDNGVNEEGLFMPQETFTLQDEYMNDTLVLIAAGENDGVVKEFPQSYHDALETNQVPHIFYKTRGGDSKSPGTGGHDGTVYKHGLYNFLRRIFHLHD